MASKIRELRDTIVQQNEMVVTLRDDKKKMRESVVQFYSALAKYKPEFLAGQTAVEDGEYPDIRGEDLSSLQGPDLLMKAANVFKAVVMALAANRDEVRSIYKELDEDINGALDKWHQITIQDRHEKKAETFRSDIVSEASRKRPETPDVVAHHGAGSRGPALPPTPPDTAGKKTPQPVTVDKQKSGTSTLGSLLSPTSAKPDDKQKTKTDSKAAKADSKK